MLVVDKMTSVALKTITILLVRAAMLSIDNGVLLVLKLKIQA